MFVYMVCCTNVCKFTDKRNCFKNNNRKKTLVGLSTDAMCLIFKRNKKQKENIFIRKTKGNVQIYKGFTFSKLNSIAFYVK